MHREKERDRDLLVEGSQMVRFLLPTHNYSWWLHHH